MSSIACLISDTHGTLPTIPKEADFIIHAGDVCPDYYVSPTKGKLTREEEQILWIKEQFFPYVEKLGKPVYMTWGNHDFITSTIAGGPSNLHIIVDDMEVIEGVFTWFSPWSPTFGNWAWMKHDHELEKIYDDIPPYVDVVVSHCPPHMCGDRAMSGQYDLNVGSRALDKRLLQLRDLRLVVCGHIHEARGEYRFKEGVPLVNVSTMDLAYRPTGKPVLWNWEDLWWQRRVQEELTSRKEGENG